MFSDFNLGQRDRSLVPVIIEVFNGAGFEAKY